MARLCLEFNVNRVSHDGILRTCARAPTPKLDCFRLQDQTEAKTVAFGYLRERLFLNSESEGPLAIRDMRRFA